ncbi:piercer of microtubule wall 1 protein [Eptesicus fuscus]|uniref:piercer of microtubule wall 1 protein n=1 Tax=Eptesicus fuscus TaxID=29078 RepID=UPI00240479DB|nr:piercer of microtubule wall 1 protein [Eptesicus fuscus]
MSSENPGESAEPVVSAEPVEPAAQAPMEKTSDFYRVDADLPARFNHPACFRGYRRNKEPVSVYRTSNQAYGGRAPTVHEMPKAFYACSNSFSRQLAAAGMFRNTSFNVHVEKSTVSGADNCITSYNRLNFHPSYNVRRPSICND